MFKNIKPFKIYQLYPVIGVLPVGRNRKCIVHLTVRHKIDDNS